MRYFKVNLAQIPTNETDVRKVSNVNSDLIKIITKATEELSDWDGMYNVDDARKRFENNMWCYLYYEDDEVMGIHWYYDIRPDVYGKQLFISKHRDGKLSQQWYEKNLSMLYKEGYENYVFYVDDWNERSLNKVQRLPGIQPISIHMFNEMIGAARKNIQI
tara:strand:- start:7509 stop:7991 length:483 start_codon:yes stop_codon:yes gene_type:complete